MSRDSTLRLARYQKPLRPRGTIWVYKELTGTTQVECIAPPADEYVIVTALIASNQGSNVNEFSLYFGSGNDQDVESITFTFPADSGLVGFNLINTEYSGGSLGGAGVSVYAKRVTAGASQIIHVNLGYLLF
jgi:hypothetical protein